MILNLYSQFSAKIKSKFKWITLDCRTQRKASGLRMWLEAHEHGIKIKIHTRKLVKFVSSKSKLKIYVCSLILVLAKFGSREEEKN